SLLMVTVDQRGWIYGFDFLRNYFWLIARSGVAGTAVAFNRRRKREIIVGLSDRSIHCYNIDSCQMVAKLPAYHNDSVRHISVHPTRQLAITTAPTEGILWDINAWERKRLLIAGNSDGSLYVWNTDTFALQWKQTVSDLAFMSSPAPGPEESSVQWNASFSTSANAELLVCGGLSNTLLVYNLIEGRMVHEVQLPSLQGASITQIAFVGRTNIVAVLSSSGEIIFVESAEAVLLSRINVERPFVSFTLSRDGRHLAAIYRDPKYVTILLRLDSLLNNKVTWTQSLTMLLTAFITEKQSEVLRHVAVGTTVPEQLANLIGAKGRSCLNRPKLKAFVKHYGNYPDKYRILIWRLLLELPENCSSYQALMQQGIHVSVTHFRRTFPLKNETLAKSMQRVLSSLAYWSPIFDGMDYLPSFVFPFIKLFHKNIFAGFEVVMTLLTNWCQKWWEYHPSPPLECLTVVEDLLGCNDASLLRHFEKHNVTSQTYAWIVMRNAFSEIFLREDWLILWDHLITNEPVFMYYVIVAYLKCHKQGLLALSHQKDFEFFFSHPSPTVTVSSVLQCAYEMEATTLTTISLAQLFHPFEPLNKGEYPVFNAYPEFIVNYQAKVKAKIRKEEMEYLRKRRMADEMADLAEELRKDKRAWESVNWKTNGMMEQWWKQMISEEEDHRRREERLQVVDKEHRAEAMRKIAEARRSFLSTHLETTQRHLANLSEVVGKNRAAMDSAVDDAIIDMQFKQVEDEWLARRQEMIDMRKELGSNLGRSAAKS
ncbi:WD40-repeat-containing domain protein, partial [Gaertneriomyces semiglobifer]